MRDLNEEYRSLLAIEAAANRQGAKSAMGLISPQQLNMELKRQTKSAAARDRRPIGRLSRAGDDVLRDLKSSGTAERNQAIAVLKSPSTAISTVGGALAGGDVFTALAAGAVPLLAQTATARGITNPLVQRYLSNSLVQGSRVPSLERPSINALIPYILQDQ